MKEENRKFTPQEYFDLENNSKILHEYFNGQLQTRSESTMRHNMMVQNVAFALRGQVKGRSCAIFTEMIKLEVVPGRHYVYPDVMLTCNTDDLKDGLIVRNPFLVAEVLAAGTEGFDKGLKFNNYLKMPSLQCYLLIAQHQYLVECYERTPQGWLYRTFEDLAEVIELSLMNLEFTMASIYEGVALSEEEAQ